MNAIDDHKADPREQLDRAVTFMKRATHFWWVVPLAMLIGGGLCVLGLLLHKPNYLSETVILYSEGVRPPDTTGYTLPASRNAAGRMREVLMSRARLEKLIREFDLYRDVREARGTVAAIEEFREDIVFKAPGSDTYSIAYKGKSPEQARDVTARLAQSVMDEEGELRRQQALVTRDFLDKERKRAEQDLKERERALAEFLAKNPGFALDASVMAGAPSTGAAIRAAEAQSRSAASSAAAAPLTVRVVPRTATGFGPAPATAALAPDPRLTAQRQAAETALAAARTNLANELARYTDQHPNVRAAKANVARAEAQLLAIQDVLQNKAAAPPPSMASDDRPAETVRRTILVRRHSVPRTEKEKAAEKTLETDLVALETEWTRLTRDVQEARARSDQLESSFFKADIAASSTSDEGGLQLSILDPAFLPTKPVPPGRTLILGVALMLSMLIGFGIVAGLTAVDDRVYDARDAAVYAPVLAEVPALATRERKPNHG